MTPLAEQVVIDSFAVGDLVRFRTTATTLKHKVCFMHGVVRAVYNNTWDKTPRYDVELPLQGDLWQNVHPSHLMKDPITTGGLSHEV